MFTGQNAELKLLDIFNFYKTKASIRIATNLISAIIDRTIDLEKNPLKGQVEELLKEQTEEFRYLISKNYKVIYWLNVAKNRIEIITVFDTRQNPSKMRKIKK